MAKKVTAKQLEKAVKEANKTASLIVRMPEGMRKHLAEVAEREGRSMNAVIVTALAIYFAQESVSAQERIEDDLQGVQDALYKLTEEVAALRKDKGE